MTKPDYMSDTNDPLPSWNEGDSKTSIIDFVKAVNEADIAEEERIAVFDNDGTLWGEQPEYFPLLFIKDDLKGMSFEEILQRYDRETGQTTEEYSASILSWLKTALHPDYLCHFTDMVFQPMLELLAYLRANGFKTHIVSGGGVEFMRPWVQDIYGIKPEEVMGSCVSTVYVPRKNGDCVLVRQPLSEEDIARIQELPKEERAGAAIETISSHLFINDNVGKPVGINQQIGRRPIAAFGNSTGDQEMVQWVTDGPGLTFGLLVDHTDGEREQDYPNVLTEGAHGVLGQVTRKMARDGDWTIVDMKKDWKVIYPEEPLPVRAKPI